MKFLEVYMWSVREIEIPLFIHGLKAPYYVTTRALKLESTHSKLKRMYFIPRYKQQPLFCYEEGSLIVTIALDICNVDKDAITPDKSKTLSGRMINDCDLIHSNLNAAEAFFIGLCTFAVSTKLVLQADVLRHQAHFAVCSAKMNRTKLHGEYHQLILSFCDRLLEQFSYAIALNRSSTL